jgi:hypothetical protein
VNKPHGVELPDQLGTWLMGYGDITAATNERTVTPVAIPVAGVANALPLLSTRVGAALDCCLLATLQSFVLDYCARQKFGRTSLNFFFVRQFPICPPVRFSQPTEWQPLVRLDDWITDRVNELVFTAWDMQPFAAEIGDDNAPFVWNEGRRGAIRAELDAAFFHLYRVERDDVEYVLGAFPIVRRKDVAKYGEYRTARLILEAYDAMAGAVSTGVPYQTVLDPPPGEGPRHPDREHVA